MSHEQSETVQRPDGRWINVYGKALPKAGQQLPNTKHYATVEDAVTQAKARSASMPHSEDEEFEFLYQMEQEAKAGTPPPNPAPVKASMGDTIAGHPITRLALGAASPLIGVAQLGAHAGDAINRATGVEPVVSPWLDKQLALYEAAKQRGMKAAGTEGFDVMGLLGSVGPTAALAKGVSAALPAAKTLRQRVGLGALQGGVAAGTQPVADTEDGFWSPKGMQTTAGAVVGVAVPLVTGAVGKVGELVTQARRPFTEKGRAAILKEFQTELMGKDPAVREQMIRAAANAKPGMGGVMPTLGETLSPMPQSTGLAAHQSDIAKMPGLSTDFARQEAAQLEAHADVLVPIARNEGALAGEKAIRDTVTGTMRDKSLSLANMAGQQVPGLESSIRKAEQSIARSTKGLSKLNPPTPTVDPSALRSAVELHAPAPRPLPLRSQRDLITLQLGPEQIARRQADIQSATGKLSELHTQGLTPLKVAPIIQRIKSVISQPGLRASDVATKSLGELEEKLTSLANTRGVIDARDLYMVRKEAGNTIKKFADESKNFDQRMTSGLVSNVQKSIDDAIEGAGGKGWKAYLQKYQELSAGPNRMEAGQELQKALANPLGTAERSQFFGKAIRDTDISALSDVEQRSMQHIAQELATRDAFKKLATKTSAGGSDAIPGDIGLPLPNLLSRPAMITNFMMKHFAKGAEKKIGALASQRYLNPNQFAASMEDLPPRYAPMMNAMRQHIPGLAGTAIGRAAQP